MSRGRCTATAKCSLPPKQTKTAGGRGALQKAEVSRNRAQKTFLPSNFKEFLANHGCKMPAHLFDSLS
jgi:hypothetical protein